MNRKLQDRTAVITGASKGLGKAMALALAAEGARIALVSRDRGKVDRGRRRNRRRGRPGRRLPRRRDQRGRCPPDRARGPRPVSQSKHPDQQRRRQRAQAGGGFHAGGMAPRDGHQRHCRVSDVPLFRARHGGAGLRPHSQHDLDHEPRFAARAHRLLHQQDGAARHDAHARPGTRARSASPPTASAPVLSPRR